MNTLCTISPEMETKYDVPNRGDEGYYSVRYYKRFFELLTSGNYDEYTPLLTALELGVEARMREALRYKPDTTLTLESYRKGHSIYLPRFMYNMYLNFLENVILPDLKEPPEGILLMITTHDGGTHSAYYRNKQYEVPMASGTIKIEDAVVINCEIYGYKTNPFTG